jgi:hypothetical protein
MRLDLATQAAARTALGDDILQKDHFHLVWWFNLRQGSLVNVAMTGSACAKAATRGFHSFNAIHGGSLHQAQTIRYVNQALGTRGFHKEYLCQICSPQKCAEMLRRDLPVSGCISLDFGSIAFPFILRKLPKTTTMRRG